MADIDNPTRRLMAHLAIPRTLDGLTERLRVDPDAGSLDVGPTLDHALGNGWVAVLGSGSPEGIVKVAGEEGIGFGKGQAKVWQGRAEAGLYNLDGDFYQLTEGGLAVLRGTDEDGGDSE